MERSSSGLDPKGEIVHTPELWFWRGAVFAGVCFTLYFGLVKELERGVWHDEALTTFFISLDWGELFSLMAQYEANMGLHYILLKAWSTISMSELWLRLFSLLAHITAGTILYFGAKRYLGVRASYFFLVLFLTHYLLVRYSVEIRGYSLAMFFIALLWTAWMRIFVDGGRSWWPAYAIVGVIAVHTHLLVSTALFFFGMSLLLIVKTRYDVIRWILSHLLIIFSFIPLLFFALSKESGQLGWIETPTIRTLIYSLFDVSGAYGQAGKLVRYSTAILVFGALPLIAFLVTASRYNTGLRSGILKSPRCIATVSGFSLPISVIFAVFALSQLEPAFSTRFFIPYVPLLMLAASMAMSLSLRHRLFFKPLPALLIMSTLAYSDRPNTGWREAHDVIESRCEHTTATLYIDPASQAASTFYRSHYKNDCRNPILPYALNASTYLDNYNLSSSDWSTLSDKNSILIILSHTSYSLDNIIQHHKTLSDRRLQCDTAYSHSSVSVFECSIQDALAP